MTGMREAAIRHTSPYETMVILVSVMLAASVPFVAG
jgi:hypothetical protein